MARAPIHPGEILADEFQEIGVTPTELSRQIDAPANPPHPAAGRRQ